MGSEGQRYELVNGELRERKVSTETSRLAARLCGRIDTFVEANDLGYVVAADAGFRCFADDPDRVRKPDLAFTSYATLPKDRYEPHGFSRTVPDLVIEIVSPNDLADEVDEKRDEWLAAGVKVVWVANPRTRTVLVFRPGTRPDLLRGPDTLAVPDLLPGFAARVADIFRRPDDPPLPSVQ
jgi:Uma2 family endonuclease